MVIQNIIKALIAKIKYLQENAVTPEERSRWNDKYTKTEVDNKISMIETNIDWKESVDTYDDIITTYPNPEDGWTVNVKDTDYTYRFNGGEWVAISANAIPKATTGVDGLMSKEDKATLDSLASNTEIDDQTPAFSQAGTRENIASGETVSTIFGKIMKWFADLKTVAFTGSYNDLADKPTIPTVEYTTVTIEPGDWSDNSCTKSVEGVTAGSVVTLLEPDNMSDEQALALFDADLQASLGTGSITFTCGGTVPEIAITLVVKVG